MPLPGNISPHHHHARQRRFVGVRNSEPQLAHGMYTTAPNTHSHTKQYQIESNTHPYTTHHLSSSINNSRPKTTFLPQCIMHKQHRIFYKLHNKYNKIIAFLVLQNSLFENTSIPTGQFAMSTLMVHLPNTYYYTLLQISYYKKWQHLQHRHTTNNSSPNGSSNSICCKHKASNNTFTHKSP